MDDELDIELSALIASSISLYLAEHSSHGEDHLIDAATHFLIVRATVNAANTEPSHQISEEHFDLLAHEAYITFIESSIIAYHTWLKEVAAQVPALPDILDITVETWAERVGDIKSQMFHMGIIA